MHQKDILLKNLSIFLQKLSELLAGNFTDTDTEKLEIFYAEMLYSRREEMISSDLPAAIEKFRDDHLAEHLRILAELFRLEAKAGNGSIFLLKSLEILEYLDTHSGIYDFKIKQEIGEIRKNLSQ